MFNGNQYKFNKHRSVYYHQSNLSLEQLLMVSMAKSVGFSCFLAILLYLKSIRIIILKRK